MTIAYFNIHKFWQQMSPHLDYGEQEETHVIDTRLTYIYIIFVKIKLYIINILLVYLLFACFTSLILFTCLEQI